MVDKRHGDGQSQCLGECEKVKQAGGGRAVGTRDYLQLR